MNEITLIQAQRLYAEATQIVAEEVKLRQKSDRHYVRLCSILRDLYGLFERRSNRTMALVLVPRTKGFTDFKTCMCELIRPLGLEERSGWYYLSVGKSVLGRVPEAELENMPFEKMKQLARVIKVKGELPPQLLERAKDHNEPAARLREHVDITLFKGHPDHSEGPKRSFPLVGGSKLIRAIQEKIERLRPAVTEDGASMPASDAQVVDFALADCLAGVQELEDHTMQQLRQGGTPHENQARADSPEIRAKAS